MNMQFFMLILIHYCIEDAQYKLTKSANYDCTWNVSKVSKVRYELF